MKVIETGWCLNHTYSVVSTITCIILVVSIVLFVLFSKFKQNLVTIALALEIICIVVQGCIFFLAPRIEYKVIIVEASEDIDSILADYKILNYNHKNNTWRIVNKNDY